MDSFARSSFTPDGHSIDLDEAFSNRCADYFYEELFQLVPGAEEMFGNRDQQRAMFATLLSTIATQAANPDLLGETLKATGLRHRELGVQSLHLKMGKLAFMKAVERADPDLSDQARKFFEDAYDGIMTAMA